MGKLHNAKSRMQLNSKQESWEWDDGAPRETPGPAASIETIPLPLTTFPIF